MSDDKNVISDEAVEAAAKCHYEVLHRLKVWEDLAPAERLLARDMMRIALEAAAPYMQAVARGEAWEEGYFAGGYTNPYRSQA